MTRARASRALENAARRFGIVHVAGVDEVGRGCLAGPVVAAAVILNPDRYIAGVADSKLLPAETRERLSSQIIAAAVAWNVCVIDAQDHRGAMMTSVQPVEYKRPGAADVEIPRRRWGEADSKHQSLQDNSGNLGVVPCINSGRYNWQERHGLTAWIAREAAT